MRSSFWNFRNPKISINKANQYSTMIDMIGYLVLGVVLAAISHVIYQLDLHKTFDDVRTYDHCKYLDIDILGPEDMSYYKDDIVIAAAGNYGDLWVKPLYFAQNGIYAIFNSSSPDYTVHQFEIEGFPKDIALYPHGIYIKGDLLFVLNHAYKFGGERVEIFQIEQGARKLTLKHTLLMDAEYNGILNDLIVISENRFLITKYLTYTDSVEGRAALPIYKQLLQTVIFLSKIKGNFVLDCQYNLENQYPVCKILDNTITTVPNGITWDQKDRVWVAESVQEEIHEYKLTPDGLQFVRRIPCDGGLDNIDYYDNKLVFGVLPKFGQFLGLQGYLQNNTLNRKSDVVYTTQVAQYDLNTNKYEILAQGNHLPKGSSGAIVRGKNLLIGSWCDITVMVCRKSE